MKHGTAYAKRLKRFYGRIPKLDCPPELAEPAEPSEQLALAVLGRGSSRAQARRALDKLLSTMVDLNEIRVTPPVHIASIIGHYVPDGLECAKRLCSVLNAVFNGLNTLRLDSLRSLGKREARQRLEKFDGADPYTVASVLLWSLGGHAVPVNERMLEALRREDIVDPKATVAEVQAFLERHISPAEAKIFCLSLENYATHGAAPKGKPRPASPAAGRASKSSKSRSSAPPARSKVASKR